MNRRLLILAPLLGLLLPACGNGADEPTDPAADAAADLAAAFGGGGEQFPEGFDPCDLLSAAEVAAASGRAVGEPEREDHMILATCTYPIEGELMPAAVLEVRPDESAYQVARDIAGSGPDPIEEVDGVGDRAFYGTMMGHNVVLLSGGRYAQLLLLGERDEASKERTIELARLVAGRLR